jgi:hypothetical protein
MSYDRSTVKKRPFLTSAVTAALAMVGLGNTGLPAAPAAMQPMLTKRSKSTRRGSGAPPMSWVKRPSQRQRRKAVRQAIANGFKA